MCLLMAAVRFVRNGRKPVKSILIGPRPDDLMRKNRLAVVLVAINAIVGVEGLAINHRGLGCSIKEVFDLRRTCNSYKWRRHRIQVLDDVNKGVGSGGLYLRRPRGSACRILSALPQEIVEWILVALLLREAYDVFENHCAPGRSWV